MVCGHTRSQSVHVGDSDTTVPKGALNCRCRPRLHVGVAVFNTTARPVCWAHSSSPRPNVWPTESPTTKIRSGRGVVNARTSRIARGAGTIVGGSVKWVWFERAALVCSALGCALSGANTIVGAGSDVVTSTSPLTSAVAAAGIVSFGHEPRNQVPCRIGCSIQRNEAVASDSVTARRSVSSGTVESPVRSAESHKKIGQW